MNPVAFAISTQKERLEGDRQRDEEIGLREILKLTSRGIDASYIWMSVRQSQLYHVPDDRVALL